MNTSTAAPSSSSKVTLQYAGSDFPRLSPDELMMLVQRCGLNDRESQKKIYIAFYSFSMAICNRYVNSYDDAVEILNDGFLKIFREIHRFKPAYSDVVASFRGWVRRIMECSSIDHFRRNKKHRFTADVNSGTVEVPDRGEDALDKISYAEIMSSVHELTPAYRTVLNLFIIEGWAHHEIASRLGISVGTSKSNLAKARVQLQKILFRRNGIQNKKSNTNNDDNNVIKAAAIMKHKPVPTWGSRA